MMRDIMIAEELKSHDLRTVKAKTVGGALKGFEGKVETPITSLSFGENSEIKQGAGARQVPTGREQTGNSSATDSSDGPQHTSKPESRPVTDLGMAGNNRGGQGGHTPPQGNSDLPANNKSSRTLFDIRVGNTLYNIDKKQFDPAKKMWESPSVIIATPEKYSYRKIPLNQIEKRERIPEYIRLEKRNAPTLEYLTTYGTELTRNEIDELYPDRKEGLLGDVGEDDIDMIDHLFGNLEVVTNDYDNPAVQQCSEGRAECRVHRGFFDGAIRLPCCSRADEGVYICDMAVFKMVKKAIFGYIRVRKDTGNCPLCNSSLDLSGILELSLDEVNRERNVQPSASLPRKWLPAEGGGILSLLNLREKFLSGLIGVLKEQIETLKYYERVVASIGRAECPICCSEEECFQFSHDQCSHAFCQLCMKTYVRKSIKNLDSLSLGYLSCPGTGCTIVIPDIVCQALTGKNVLHRLHINLLKLAARTNQNLFICLNPVCENVVDISGGICGSKVVCDACKGASCKDCQVFPYHDKWSCRMYKKALTSSGADEMFEASKKREPHKYKKCTLCKAEIYKEWGCNRVHCSSCQKKFCWICGQPTPDDYRHFKMEPGREGCALWDDDALDVPHAHDANRDAYVVAGMERQIPAANMDLARFVCARCQSENMLSKWGCGHYFCRDCESHMLQELGEQVYDGRCMECAIRDGVAKPSATQNGLENPCAGVTMQCFICGVEAAIADDKDICTDCEQMLERQ